MKIHRCIIMNSFGLYSSVVLCIFLHSMCVCEREKKEEKWLTWVQYLMPSFMLSLSIKSSLIHTEKLFISKTSNYMTALMAQPFIFTFFLAQYMYSSSTSQQDTSSSNPKCKCQKPISCVSLLFLFDEHQFWFTTLVCVHVCHIPNVGDAS